MLAVMLFRGPAWTGRRGGLWLALFLAQAEILLIWLPAAVLAIVAAGLRGRRRGRG